MSDKLVVEIDSKDAEVAMRNLDRLTTAAEQMGKAFENTKGATSALRELRLMLTGIKGQGSSLDELKNSIQSLNSTADSLKRSFAGSVGQLGRIFKNEMAELKSIVQETGLGVGRAAAKGIEDGMAEAPAAIRKQGRTIAAAAKAEATRIYEAMVAGQANAKIKDVSTLFKLDEAGATLSPYHKQVLENWKKSSAETFKALKAQLADESQKIAAAVKTEEAQLQAALRAMEQNSSMRESSLAGIYASSLARGRQDMVRVKTSLKTQAVEIKVAVQTEEAQLQAALKAMEQAGSIRESSLTSIYARSLARGKQDIARIKANLKGQAAEIKATVKTEEAALQAALGAMEQASTIRQSSLASIYAGSLSRGKQDMARVKAQLKLQADEIIAAAKTEAGRIQAQVAAATNNASGAFQRYSPNTGMAGAVVDPLAKGPKKQDVTGLAEAFDKLTISGNNAHSMARGLASGFGLLWLTWGNLAPLFVGAAISNGFVQTAKTGMQVAHTLETIAILGGNTAEEMAALNIELDRIGNSGPFGPLAVAESMKVLSLAGLKANEILAVTQEVLNFSIAGTTDLKTAADALVSISTAFGMGAAGFGRVSDVVSKAAAESKTSVESFANAMKTASVINKQYGVSLEDTATGIAALSQLGIEGTAAGTALRNMYADLSGRSIQVSKVLKAQGIEMRDTVTGGFRPMLEVVAELNTKLQGLDAIGQKNLLQAILSERGAKGIVELLQLINTEAKNAGAGMSNALQQMRKSIEESYGFAAISAAKISQTAESQFKSVKATLETSMNDAYKSVEPTLRLIADGLRKAFSSPEFIAGLSQMVTMTAQLALSFVELTRFIVEHQGAIAAAAAAYSLISLAIRHKAATMVASTAATTADTTATLANNAAKAGAVGALGTLGRLIPGLGTVITLAAGAWMAYDFWQSKSKDTAAAASDLYNNNIIKNLNDEANRLRELNDLRAKGLTLSEAQQLLNDQNSREKGIAPASDGVVEAIRNEYSAVQKLNKAKAEQARQTTKEGAHRVIAAENALAVAKKATSTAKVQEAKVISDLADAQARVVQERKRDAGFLAAEAKKREELFKSGIKGFELGAGNSAERRTYQDTKIAIDNRLAEIVKGYNKEKEEARNAAADEKAMLDSKHRNGLISEGEYQSQLFNITKESEQKQLAQIKSSRDEYSAIYQGRIKDLADQWLEAESRPTKNEADRKAQQDDLNKIADAWENLGNTATTEIEKMDSDARQLASKGMRDLAIASDNAAGAIYKLRESERKYWADDKATLDKAKALDAVNAKYRNLNDSVFSLDEASRAYEVAAAESTAKHEAHIEELTNSLNVAELAAQAFWDGAIGRGGFDTGEFALWLELKKVATDTGNAIADAKTKAGMSASASGQAAFDRKRREQNTKLANDLSDAVMTGLFDGAEAGKKKLRDVLVAELRKPIKMVVDLVINTVVGGIMGGIGGAAQAGQGGAGGANTVQTGFSALNSSISSTIGNAFSKFAGSSVGQSLGLSNAQAIAGNNPSAYVPPGGELTATGQQMSQALGVVGDTLAGYAMGSMARSLISGGYSVGKGMDNFQKAGIAVGSALGGPVAGAIIGAGAGVFNRAFGRKLKDSGVQGTFGGQSGFEGESFEFYKGGWFRSDKTKTKPLDEEVRKALGDAFGAMRAEVGTFATLLGLETDRLAGFTTSIKISTKGLDEKAAQEKIQEALATANNELAEQVIGSWQRTVETISRSVSTNIGGSEGGDFITTTYDEVVTKSSYTASEFARTGEKAIDTLRRLATSLGTVNSAFELLGVAMLDASLASGDMASRLIEQSGGGEAFAANLGTYYDNFYSEAEKTANVTRSVSDALAAVGLAMPTTRDEFRALVESQIALGDSGTQAVAALLGVSGAFASVVPAAEAVFKSFGQYMPFFAGLADSALSKLVDASGGVGALAGNMGAFVDGFYTDAEKLAVNTQNVTDALAKLGFEMPKTREEFKTMVAAQLATAGLQLGSSGEMIRVSQAINESAATSAAGLLALSGAVNGVLPPFEEAAAGVEAVLGGVSDAMRRLQSDTANLEVELLRSQGNTTGADASQRAIDTAGLTAAELAVYDYNAALRAQIVTLDAATQAAQEQADIRAGFERQLLQLQGDTAALRLLDIAGMDSYNIALYDQVQALTEATEQTNIRAGLERQLLQLQGDTAALRLLDIAGMDEYNIALYDQVQALTEATEQTNIRAGFERQLLELQGDTAALRLLDIAGMDSYNIALYDQVQALTEAQAAAAQAAENMRALRSSLIGLESSFTGGGFSRQYQAQDAAGEVQSLLAGVGIQKDAGQLTAAIMSATSGEVEAYFREIWDVLDTDEARQKLVDVTGVMMDLATGAGSATEALQKQQDALQTLAQDAARLFSARNTAGNLMDRIGGAMGKQGTFGAQRESELWGALGSTSDAEKQVELAGQLTDMVISRQQLEVQNAERLLDFGRSMRSYVDGLKLGNLSPLTNAEKLAEASAQYNEMLGKAQGGDTNAQAGLQGIASTYLELARTYFAGNEQFSTIFGSVTSSLDALGVSSMSEAQQQLSLGTQSLGELQRLYSITETAYGSLNAQYETAVGELTAAQDALVLQSDSLDQLKDIAGLLSGLPAEIAVRLPAINTESATYLPPAMLVPQGAQGDNAALIAELQALRKEVAELRAENRQDAQMVAGATVASASASASQIADATAKAAYTTTVKQGAVLV